MPTSFPSSPKVFVGRDDYLIRYRSRLEHFPLSVFIGLPGVGKTTLLLRLAAEAKEIAQPSPSNVKLSTFFPLFIFK